MMQCRLEAVFWCQSRREKGLIKIRESFVTDLFIFFDRVYNLETDDGWLRTCSDESYF